MTYDVIMLVLCLDGDTPEHMCYILLRMSNGQLDDNMSKRVPVAAEFLASCEPKSLVMAMMMDDA